MAAFNVGGIAIDSSACALVDLGPLNAALEQPISIVLGMPAIVQADWSFDFPERRWSVRPPLTNWPPHHAELLIREEELSTQRAPGASMAGVPMQAAVPRRP
jgi:hypothetical protein